MNQFESRPVVYTAQSKHVFYARMLICRFVIEHGAVPLNPFNAFGYFLYDLVDRDKVRNCNNNLIRIADEVWSFGEIADGVWRELEYAAEIDKPVRFFSVGAKYTDIEPMKPGCAKFEPELCAMMTEEHLRTTIVRLFGQRRIL